MSFNKVIIQGNLGQDPELRHTANQTAVCTLSVATTDYGKDKEGNKTEFTEWHRVQCWSKTAENCAKYLSKGKSVLVEGRLQTRKWTDKNDIERYSTEIVANNVQFLSASGGSDKPAADVPPPAGWPAMDDIPFASVDF